MKDNDLEALERRTFRTVFDHGLWDLLIASVVAMFAIAPFLSPSMGDFWSSAVFVPIWGAIYLAIRRIQERVVVPRVGFVRFGSSRRKRLRSFTVLMLIFNLMALALGLGAAFAVERATGEWLFTITFSLLVLVGFSLAAQFLHIPRLFVYGLMFAALSQVGEWLYRQGQVSHHGYPVVAGITAGVIATVGLIRFARLLRRYDRVDTGSSAAMGHG